MTKISPPSRSQIASHIFRTPSRVKQLMDEGVIPADVQTLDEARRYYIKDLLAKATVRTAKGSPLEDARAHALRLDIGRKQLELAELEGQLVRIPAVEAYWAAMVATARSKLLSAPNKCAALVSPDVAAVVQAAVRSVVHDALNEIARDAVPPDMRKRAPRRTSAESKRKEARR